MGFWDDLAEVAGKAFVAIAGSQKVMEWLKLDLDDAEVEIKRYVRTASTPDIKLTFEGFVNMCTGTRDLDEMRKLLLVYRSFCIYTAHRFGDD